MPAQNNTSYWLKSIGAASDPMVENYLTTPLDRGGRLDLLSEIRFAKNKRPSGMRSGHKMVLYAASHERIFGVAIVRNGEIHEKRAKGEERWPWTLEVDVPLLVGDLRIAPSLASMNVGSLSVRQQSHISLTERQYALAIEAFTAAVRP